MKFKLSERESSSESHDKMDERNGRRGFYLLRRIITRTKVGQFPARDSIPL